MYWTFHGHKTHQFHNGSTIDRSHNETTLPHGYLYIILVRDHGLIFSLSRAIWHDTTSVMTPNSQSPQICLTFGVSINTASVSPKQHVERDCHENVQHQPMQNTVWLTQSVSCSDDLWFFSNSCIYELLGLKHWWHTGHPTTLLSQGNDSNLICHNCPWCHNPTLESWQTDRRS